MIKIPLTQDQYALIDDEDAGMIFKHKWFAVWCESIKGFYAMCAWKSQNGSKTTMRMHRLLLDAKKGQRVDHINRNTLDNRRANLRITSPSINVINSGAYINNKSGYKGVSTKKTGYQVEIRMGEDRITSKLISNPRDAALLRDALVREWIKKKVYLNFPHENPDWAIVEAKRLIDKRLARKP